MIVEHLIHIAGLDALGQHLVHDRPERASVETIFIELAQDAQENRDVSEEEIQKAIEILRQESTQMTGNWNKRYRENMEKIKTGNIELVAEIVRNLTRIDRENRLSAGEKKMLTNVRKILQSEIMLAPTAASSA